MLDLGTQVLLVIVGLFVLFSPTALWDNIVWGVAPTWTNVVIGVTLAMIAYTGIETISNMAEEAQVPERTVDYVLRHAPCRVVIASDAAAPDTTSAAAVSAALSEAVARPPGPRSRPPDR